MGILNSIGLGGGKGLRDCRDNDDGSTTCVKVKVDRSGNVIAGEEQVTFGIDDKTCNPVFVGNMRLGDDPTIFNDIIAEKQKACRAGIKKTVGVN